MNSKSLVRIPVPSVFQSPPAIHHRMLYLLFSNLESSTRDFVFSNRMPMIEDTAPMRGVNGLGNPLLFQIVYWKSTLMGAEC